MAEHIHRNWSITTQATEKGFIFRCRLLQQDGSCEPEIGAKAYGYFQNEAEAILAGMVWIDQQQLPDHLDGLLFDNEEPEN
jgi:uncharacterized protein involved in type VI secretion and phage assembly